MIDCQRTHSNHKDFIVLVKELDAYLTKTDGEEHSFYDQYNRIHDLKNVIIVYENKLPQACGAFKEYSPGVVEIKRMYTLPESRGKGHATLILNELEKWASELGYDKCILETGKRQPEAISLYLKNQYTVIPNYGQYVDMENSVCFEKILK